VCSPQLFVEWLRGYNEARPSGAARIGFYGLDLYSLRASMEAVVQYLDKIDPEQLRQNVAAWTAMLATLSGGIEPEPKQP